MATNEEKGIPISKITEDYDDKGRKIFKVTYLRETPKEYYDHVNKLYNDWKTTKQIKYDNNGMKIGE